MKAYKLLLEPYPVKLPEGPAPSLACPKCGEQIGVPQETKFRVVDSLVGVLMSAHLVRPPMEYLKAADLADRIRKTKDKFILLDEAEWESLKSAFEKWPCSTQQGPIGFGQHEAELVRRVMEPEEVPVKEKEATG